MLLHFRAVIDRFHQSGRTLCGPPVFAPVELIYIVQTQIYKSVTNILPMHYSLTKPQPKIPGNAFDYKPQRTT